MKLYELATKFQLLNEILETEGGELTPELEQKLNTLEGTLEDKIDSIGKVIQHLLGDAQKAKTEANRLTKLAVLREKATTRLKLYLLDNMKKIGRNSVETPLFRVRVQTNSRPSISWTGDIADLPIEYLRVKKELDNTAAYNTWRTAGKMPDGFVVEVGQHLRIT